jgi:hypothetical protein
MMNIIDILKSKKFTANHRLYLIAGLKIPFFISFPIEKQADLCGISERSIHRIREDLLYFKIIKKLDIKTFIFDFERLENLL